MQRGLIMRRRPYLFGSRVLAGILASLFGAVMLGLPAASPSATPVAISADETAATLTALKPPKRTRPVIAVIGANAGTETTDYLIPFGVLKRADIGEVVALSTQSGAITMMPALKIMPDSTIAEFDARLPEGADYVIVPAMHHDNDPAVLKWIKAQAAGGAIIIGICSGARILMAAMQRLIGMT
jgi:putative intracellular protease/amidase